MYRVKPMLDRLYTDCSPQELDDLTRSDPSADSWIAFTRLFHQEMIARG